MIPIAEIKGLGWFWKHREGVLTFVVIVAIGVFLWVADGWRKDRDAYKAQLDDAQQTIIDQKAAFDASTAALQRKVESDQERNEFELGAVRRNQADRAAGDGPISPVLFNGLQQLRSRQAEHAKRTR